VAELADALDLGSSAYGVGVRLSSPAPKHGGRSSVGRAPDCGSGCRGFESHRSPHYKKSFIYLLTTIYYHRGVAQMGARVLWEHEVAGSIPVTPTTNNLICGSGSVVERHLAKVNVASSNLVFRSICGCNSMVECQPSKLVTRVRFPSPAPKKMSMLLTSFFR
jgi:hypothetical protein